MPEISKALYRAGEGEPVVLLHGFTATWHCWRPILPELVARYEVIAPTLAGHEGGPAFDAEFNLEAVTDSLEGHLDELGVETAHFVGNSMGGTLAIQLAKRGRARSVVALSPGAGWQPGSGESRRVGKFFRRQLAITRMSNKSLEKVMGRPRPRQLALRDVMRRGQLVDPRDAVAMARASLSCTVSDQVIEQLLAEKIEFAGFESITAPVLLAWAEHDRILPKETCSWRLRRDIPGAEYRVLPGVGHVPMWDDHHLVEDTIIDWVTQHANVAVTA
jgi:pimeloyl-ACP methyl ester carboxylesterase